MLERESRDLTCSASRCSASMSALQDTFLQVRALLQYKDCAVSPFQSYNLHMDKHRADNTNSGRLWLWYLHTIPHYNCRDASFKNCGQAQTGIAQRGENIRTTPARETTSLGYSWNHWEIRDELRIYNIYHYTCEGEWMISSSPA